MTYSLKLLFAYVMTTFAIAPFSLQAADAQQVSIEQLAQQLNVGDIVFVRIDTLPFRKIAKDTGSWTNHVGIVERTEGNEPLIAESTIPVSTITPLSKFIKRSENGRIAVTRLNTDISKEQRDKLSQAAYNRLGVTYDTGFDLYSNRQFCSRYVREVVDEATSVKLGEIQTLKTLFADNPDADLLFWKTWYLGMIPWKRSTVTPASILNDKSNTHMVFDGFVKKT